MSDFVLRNAVSLLFLLGLTGYLIYQKSNDRLLLFTLVIYTLHNLCSLLWLLTDSHPLLIHRGTHAASFAALIITPTYFWMTAGLPTTKRKRLGALLVMLAALPSMLAVFSPLFVADVSIVEGSFDITYGIARKLMVPGVGVSICTSLAILIYGYNLADTATKQVQCFISIIAVLTFGFMVGTLRVLFILGTLPPQTYLLPIAISIFLCILVFNAVRKKSSVDIRRLIPGSTERESSTQILETFSAFTTEDIGYKEAMNQISRELVDYKINKAKSRGVDTMRPIAESMGMTRSGLSKLISRNTK